MEFQMDAEGDVSFICSILQTLHLKAMGNFFPSIDRFRRDCDIHFLPSEITRVTSMMMSVPNMPCRDQNDYNPAYATARYNPFLGASILEPPIQKDDFEVCEGVPIELCNIT
jgi:hypothetical protein